MYSKFEWTLKQEEKHMCNNNTTITQYELMKYINVYRYRNAYHKKKQKRKNIYFRSFPECELILCGSILMHPMWIILYYCMNVYLINLLDYFASLFRQDCTYDKYI